VRPGPFYWSARQGLSLPWRWAQQLAPFEVEKSMGYFIATLIGATLTFNAGDILASEQNQKKGLWIEYEYSERSVDDRHCNLNFGAVPDN
jgi:hypothetical protein